MSTLNHSLFWISFVLSVFVSVTVLFAVVPAYWRTHDRAFLYLVFAYMLAIFDNVADHTIALWHVPLLQYIAYLLLRRMVYLADVVLFGLGVVSLTRSYFTRTRATDDTTPSA